MHNIYIGNTEGEKQCFNHLQIVTYTHTHTHTHICIYTNKMYKQGFSIAIVYNKMK